MWYIDFRSCTAQCVKPYCISIETPDWNHWMDVMINRSETWFLNCTDETHVMASVMIAFEFSNGIAPQIVLSGSRFLLFVRRWFSHMPNGCQKSDFFFLFSISCVLVSKISIGHRSKWKIPCSALFLAKNPFHIEFVRQIFIINNGFSLPQKLQWTGVCYVPRPIGSTVQPTRRIYFKWIFKTKKRLVACAHSSHSIAAKRFETETNRKFSNKNNNIYNSAAWTGGTAPTEKKNLRKNFLSACHLLYENYIYEFRNHWNEFSTRNCWRSITRLPI